MVAIPDQLTWELTRKNNCFLKKKSGHTKRSGMISFSTEKGNITSLNKFKYSGLANTQAVDVICSEDNRAQLVQKSGSQVRASKPNKTVVVSNVNKDFRRAVPHILKQSCDVYYRRDLQQPLLAKYTKVYQANRRANGVVRTVPTKKGRGTLKSSNQEE